MPLPYRESQKVYMVRIKKTPAICILLLSILFHCTSFCQRIAIDNSRPTRVYLNRSNDFQVVYSGRVVDESDTVINLIIGDREHGLSYIRAAVAKEPMVFLPGTFGQSMNIRKEGKKEAASDRKATENFRANGLEFVKEYWVVYAGAGMWETVINCYTFDNGRYFICSLHHEFASDLRKTGVVPHTRTTGDIENQLVRAMKDGDNMYVETFDSVLKSFKPIK